MSESRRPSVPLQFAKAIKPWCAREGCNRLAVYQPVLQFRVHRNHPPAEVMIGMGICPHCVAAHGGVDDYLSDAGFEQITVGFTLAGKRRPTRALTTIRWQELPAERA